MIQTFYELLCSYNNYMIQTYLESGNQILTWTQAIFLHLILRLIAVCILQSRRVEAVSIAWVVASAKENSQSCKIFQILRTLEISECRRLIAVLSVFSKSDNNWRIKVWWADEFGDAFNCCNSGETYKNAYNWLQKDRKSRRARLD